MVKLAWQSTILVVGPSGQGKSTLARQIVDRRNEIFDADSKICFWYYDTFESVPDSMKNRKDIILREGLPNLEELKKYKKDQAMIVIDDLMTKIDQNSGMERLVSVLAHHYDMTVPLAFSIMSYGKYVLLSVEEHEDLIANQKEPNPISKLIETPMENDIKIAHLQSQLTNLVKKRLNTTATVEDDRKKPKLEELYPQSPIIDNPAINNGTSSNPDNLNESKENDDDIDLSNTFFNHLNNITPTSSTPVHITPPVLNTPNSQKKIGITEARKNLYDHLLLHSHIFQFKDKLNPLFVNGEKIPKLTVDQIVNDFINTRPLTGVQEHLPMVTKALKESDFPEEYILNPKRKYPTRESRRVFDVTTWRR
ncbi:unnamed protein product [Caenorhabditis brenneri]